MSKVEKFPTQFNDPSDQDDQDPEIKKEERLKQLDEVRQKLVVSVMTVLKNMVAMWKHTLLEIKVIMRE